MFGDGLGPPSNVGKHGNQGIGWWPEAPGPDGGGTVSREDLQLLLGIGAQIGLCALDAGVAKPQRDLADVPGRRERVHRTGMPQHVRRNPLAKDRRLLLCRALDVLRQTERKSVAGHGLPAGIEEYLGSLRIGTDRKPRAQCELSLLPEREDPFTPSLAHDVHGGQEAVREIAQL